MDRGPAKLSELIARIQSSHEAILKEAGCLKENQTLTYGKVFPVQIPWRDCTLMIILLFK